MKRLIAVALFAIVLSPVAEARGRLFGRRSRSTPAPAAQPVQQTTVCPNCGGYHNTGAGSAQLNGQAIAQARANYMARHNYRNHPPRSAGNFASVGRFEGVGWSSNPNASHGSVPTCIAGGGTGTRNAGSRWQLVGDAAARGPRGTYRVRIWR